MCFVYAWVLGIWGFLPGVGEKIEFLVATSVPREMLCSDHVVMSVIFPQLYVSRSIFPLVPPLCFPTSLGFEVCPLCQGTT